MWPWSGDITALGISFLIYGTGAITSILYGEDCKMFLTAADNKGELE